MICWIHHPYKCIRLLKVVSPVRSNRFLASHIPNVQLVSKHLGKKHVPYNTWHPYYPLCSKVLILKPKVGEMVSIGSPLNRFKMVVLPALSSPLKQHCWAHDSSLTPIPSYSIRIRISFSLVLIFLRMVNKPMVCRVWKVSKVQGWSPNLVSSPLFLFLLSFSLMLTWRSISTRIQKSALHTSRVARIPPRRTNISNSSSRWGSFERITPVSLASVDVKTFPRRLVPDNIPRPSYAAQGLASNWESDIPYLSTQEQVQGLKDACQLAKQVLTMGGKMCLVSLFKWSLAKKC